MGVRRLTEIPGFNIDRVAAAGADPEVILALLGGRVRAALDDLGAVVR